MSEHIFIVRPFYQAAVCALPVCFSVRPSVPHALLTPKHLYVIQGKSNQYERFQFKRSKVKVKGRQKLTCISLTCLRTALRAG